MSEATEASENPYPQPGDILEGKYEVQRVLGTGAMGAVVRATHMLRQAPVALKFMSPDVMNRPGIVQRFLNEGVAASQIDSDHVVKIFDVCELDSGVPYLVMEYLEGEDLQELIQREGNPGLGDIPRAVHFCLQTLRGLQVAHRAHIVHRDMKPANLFIVTKDGEPDFVKIVDFGISKIRQPDQIELTNVGSALGTPLYMSPEQARNPKDVDPRSDLYAVAAILYELIAGQPPFVPESGTLSELMIKLGTEEPASLEGTRSDLPVGFWATVAKGLAKLPDQRYQSAQEFAEALTPFADERSDYVLRAMTSRTSAGVSRVPPPPGPPTHIDDEPAGMKESAVDGTVVIPGSEPGADATQDPLSGGAAVASSKMGSIAPPAPPSPKGADAVADTQQGTVKDAERVESSGRPILLATLGGLAFIVAVLVAFVVTRGEPSSASPSSTETAMPDLTPPPEPTPEPAPPPAPEPTAEATAEPTTEPTAKVTVKPPPVAPVPVPTAVVPPPPVQPPPPPPPPAETGLPGIKGDFGD
jgi:serine/threonine-protein kinase